MQAKRITLQKDRANLYKKAQTIFNDNVPWAPIAHSKIFRTMSKNVIGYKIDPLGGDIFKTIDFK